MPDSGAAYGIMGPAADHALAARRHMHEFGTTKEQLGAVALSARDYAAKRPDAYLHDRPLTMQDYLDARPIAEPLGKYDCCLVADGGCAFIVTTAERAADMATTPVRVSGYGFSHTIAEGFERQQFTRSGVGTAKDDAFRSAGLTLEDMDVAQVYDCFTIEVLMALEALGFCKEGESGPFVADGNLGADAPIPINTAGGELAWGYMQGFTSVVEGIKQLRGEGGATQVQDARDLPRHRARQHRAGRRQRRVRRRRHGPAEGSLEMTGTEHAAAARSRGHRSQPPVLGRRRRARARHPAVSALRALPARTRSPVPGLRCRAGVDSRCPAAERSTRS